MERAPASPVAAATLLLLRDSPVGLQVLMTTRHGEAGFAAGASVFPGGKVSAEDAVFAEHHAPRLGIASMAFAFRIAALRETYEESALLLARRHGKPALLSAAELARLRPRPFGDLVEAGEVEPAHDLLVPFAHWITPANRPKRFDAHFFLAPAPPDQIAEPDGREALDARWVVPAQALADADAGRVAMVFVTRMNLAKLGRSGTVAEAIDTARRDTIVTVTPEPFRGPDGPMFRMPAAAGYGGTEFPTTGIPLG